MVAADPAAVAADSGAVVEDIAAVADSPAVADIEAAVDSAAELEPASRVAAATVADMAVMGMATEGDTGIEVTRALHSASAIPTISDTGDTTIIPTVITVTVTTPIAIIIRR